MQLVEVQTTLADATGETLVTMLEVRRFNYRFGEAKRELRNLPIKERGPDWVRARIADFRQTAGGPTSPTALVHDVVALLTEARSRRIAAERGWAILFALPACDRLIALDCCPRTGAQTFGQALIKLLYDEQLFNAAGTLSICGNKGSC